MTATDLARHPAPAAAEQYPTECTQSRVELLNSTFEEPVVSAGSYHIYPADDVPGWDTTDVQNSIEIWSSGFKQVPAHEGQQFAELNAYSPSRLYQDVATTPGQTLAWSLWHRGREGVDVMKVVIGAPGGTLVQSGGDLSDGTTAWGHHVGTYTVPAGQTITRFGFEAVSATGGSAGIGNFLDDITFDSKACIIASKSVVNLSREEGNAQVGDVLRYTVTARNDGGTASSVTVSSDELPSVVDYVPGSLRIASGPNTGALTDASADDQGEYNRNDNSVQVRLGAGASATAGGALQSDTATSYSFDVLVTADAANTTFSNDAVIDYGIPSTTLEKHATSNEVTTTVDPAADLGITKELTTSSVVAGSSVSYTLIASSSGPQLGTGVAVEDILPPGLTDVTVSSDTATCTVTAGILRCTIPDLEVETTAEITVTGTVSPSFTPGEALVNTASITGDKTDHVSENNSSTVSDTVGTSADVSIQKGYVPATTVAGDDVTYTLTAHNAGPSVARKVVITDPLDSSTTFTSATGAPCTHTDGTVHCDVGTLGVGEDATVTIKGTLASDHNGAVQNTATVTTSSNDPDATNNASSVSFTPDLVADLQLTKTASAASANAGDAVTFTLVAKNNGPSVAEDAVLSDELPTGFSVTGVDAPTGATCSTEGGHISCSWDALASGAESTVEVTAVIAADAPAGPSINTASLAAPVDDPNTDNNSSSATVTVAQSADLEIGKVADPTVAVAGTTQRYNITVTNAGPSLARGVTISDALPADFTQASTETEGCAIAAKVLTCEVGSLAPNAEMTVTVTGKIRAAATKPISNTATTSSATPDPDTTNNSARITTEVDTSADVSITKTADPEEVALGGTVTYTVTVRNDGPSAAKAVNVAEQPGAGLKITQVRASAGEWSKDDASWAVGTLAPGADETLTVTAKTTATGTLSNTAVASSATEDPDDGPDDLTATAEIESVPAADLSISKTASTTTAEVGDQISYTLVVHNHGPSPATNVTVTDEIPAGLIDASTESTGCSIAEGTFSCALDSLALAEEKTFEFVATVNPSTAVESVSNTASVSAAEADPDAENNSSTAETAITGTPAVELVKTAAVPADANGDGRLGAGDTIAYTFTVRNPGPVVLTEFAITDELLGGAVACPEGADEEGAPVSLNPGDEVTCTAVTYTLTQADVDAGTVHNEASVTAQSARGEASDTATADTAVVGVNGVSLAKSAAAPVDVDGDGRLGTGDTVDYSFTVRNTGTTTVTDAVITDPMLGGELACAALAEASLAPGDEVDCGPVTYTLTQADVDNGTVHNEAAVAAESARGPVSDTAAADVTVTGTDAVEVAKTAGAPTDVTGDGRIGAGDEIDYTFTVRNLGTTTLDGLSITDPLLGGTVSCPAVQDATLAPGAEVVCGPKSYTLSQEDVESGSVHNEATVTGDGKNGDVSDDGSTEVVITGTAEVLLQKSAGVPTDTTEDGRLGAGDAVDYTFTVKNTGTTVLTDVVITDPLLGGEVTCASLAEASLAPGAETECGPVRYVLTQADVDAGAVHNAATATAQSARGEVTDSASVDVAIVGANGVSLAKSAAAPVDVDGDGRLGAGDTIDYSFTVQNTGTTTLTAAAISDEMLGGEVACASLAEASLAPGEAVNCGPVTYTVKQRDIDAGVVDNVASVTARAPKGDVADTAAVDVTVEGSTAVEVQKTAGVSVDSTGDGRIGAGDQLGFSFRVRNLGTTTLHGLSVRDPLLGGALNCPALRGAALAPGAEISCGPVNYTLSQDDIEAGSVPNKATVTGEGETGEVVDTGKTEVVVTGVAQVALDKTATDPIDTTGDGRIGAGDEVEYSFRVRNTGTTELTDAVITDPLLGGEVACAAPKVLAPGAEVSCGPVAYVLTQADVDAGRVENVATVTVDSSRGQVTGEGSVSVTVDAEPALTLEKSGGNFRDANSDGKVSAGDTMEFSFAVENTGTVTATGIEIDDPMLGGQVPCEIPDLGPGESAECGPVQFTLTAAQAGAVTVTNTASVTAIAGAAGDSARGPSITASDTVSVPVAAPVLPIVLPITGATVPWIVAIAGALLLAAGVILGLRTRRRRSIQL